MKNPMIENILIDPTIEPTKAQLKKDWEAFLEKCMPGDGISWMDYYQTITGRLLT